MTAYAVPATRPAGFGLQVAVYTGLRQLLLAPAVWEGDPPGGHHRKGVLKFDAVNPRPQDIELRITRAGEPKPRSFRWQLK